MTQASRKSHDKIKLKAGSIKKQILWLIRGNRYTTYDLEVITGLHHQTISARITDLHADGLIKPDGERRGQTVWVDTPSGEIEAVKASVEAERKKKWVKQGLQLFKDMPEDLREQLKQMAA